MPNIVNTSVDTGSVVVQGDQFEDALVTFGGADTFVEGTILARDSSTLKFVLFEKGGSTNENGIPRAVLTHELVRTGSGDEATRVLTAGKVNQNRLVIDADGDASNIDGAVRDDLRDTSIIPVDVEQLARLDNPQPTESDS